MTCFVARICNCKTIRKLDADDDQALKALQVGKPAAEGFRGLPSWTADVSRGWLTLWMKLPSKQHARAAFAEMLGHCPDVLATQISAKEAQQDDRQTVQTVKLPRHFSNLLPTQLINGLSTFSNTFTNLCRW